MVIVTTPNREHNIRFASLPAGEFRHRDHRFEWTRAEFAQWAERVATTHGYTVAFAPIGGDDANRIAQAPNPNVLRYAGARSVHVSLRADDGQLILSVADDGCGFDPTAVAAGEHFGLVGMRERALLLDGRLDISGRRGRGTKLRLAIPLRGKE